MGARSERLHIVLQRRRRAIEIDQVLVTLRSLRGYRADHRRISCGRESSIIDYITSTILLPMRTLPRVHIPTPHSSRHIERSRRCWRSARTRSSPTTPGGAP